MAFKISVYMEERRQHEEELRLMQPSAKNDLQKQQSIRDRVDLFLTILETRQVHLPLVSRILNIDKENLRLILAESGLECRFSRNGQVVAFRARSAEEFIKLLGNSFGQWAISNQDSPRNAPVGRLETTASEEEVLKLGILSDIFREMFAGESRFLVTTIADLLSIDPVTFTQIVEEIHDSHGFRVIGEYLVKAGVEVADFIDRVMGHTGERDREQFEDEIDGDFSRWTQWEQKGKSKID